MPALALTDLANAFGLIKFYKAARGAGVKPIVGCDVWITHDTERDRPFRAILLAASRDGYLKLCDWLSRAYREQPASRPRRNPARVVRRRHRRPDRAVRRARRRRRPRAAAGQSRGRRARRARMVGVVPAALLPRSAARRTRRRRRAGRRHRRARRPSSRCPSSPRIRSQFLAREDFRAHEARVCIAEGHVLSDARRPKRFTPEQYFTTQAEMAAKFADLPEALANTVAIAQRCNLTIPLGKQSPAGIPDAGRRHDRRTPAQRGGGGPRAAPGAASIPTPPCATRSVPNTSRASSSRRRRSADGLCRLLPDRRRLHQLGQAQPACRSVRGAAPARVRSSPIRSASPISIRCATRCCSSASSIPSACRCPTSTSTSARTAATASSTTSRRSTARTRCRRSRRSARWRRAPPCATSAACSTCRTCSSTASRS